MPKHGFTGQGVPGIQSSAKNLTTEMSWRLLLFQELVTDFCNSSVYSQRAGIISIAVAESIAVVVSYAGIIGDLDDNFGTLGKGMEARELPDPHDKP